MNNLLGSFQGSKRGRGFMNVKRSGINDLLGGRKLGHGCLSANLVLVP